MTTVLPVNSPKWNNWEQSSRLGTVAPRSPSFRLHLYLAHCRPIPYTV